MAKVSASGAKVGTACCALNFKVCAFLDNQQVAAVLLWAPELC